MDKIQETFLYMLKVERNFSEYTLKSYHDDLVQFNNFLEREHLQLETFEYKDARNYLAFLYSNQLKRTTVSRKISTLRTFYEFWMTQDNSIINPFVQLVHLKKRSIYLNSFMKKKWKHFFKL